MTTKMIKHSMLSVLFISIICFMAIARASAQQITDRDDIYTEVEVLPAFKGGFEGLVFYMGDHLKYPVEARNANVQGKVMTEFVVEKDGTLSGISVKRGIGSGCDEEAIRVLKTMPPWSPGLKDGKVVRTRMVLPIAFAL